MLFLWKTPKSDDRQNFHFEHCKQPTDRQNRFAVIAPIIPGVPDIVSNRPSVLCWTFWAPCQTFSQLMTCKYQWSFLFSLWDILYWILLDKVVGKVWALCRTLVQVCLTCPAPGCPAYFVITALCLWLTSISNWGKGKPSWTGSAVYIKMGGYE